MAKTLLAALLALGAAARPDLAEAALRAGAGLGRPGARPVALGFAPALAGTSAFRSLSPAAALIARPSALAPAAAAANDGRAEGPRAAAARGVPGAPDPARTDELLGRLAPEEAARVPDEEAKSLSGELLGEGGRPAAEDGEDAAIAGAPSAPAPLSPPSAARAPSRRATPSPAAARRAPNGRERLHYWRGLGGAFLWYMTTNVSNKWRGHREQLAAARAAGEVSVSRHRSFFAAMRTTGMSGRFYALGSVPREDHEMMDAMRGAFESYFDHPAVGERELDSLQNFMARAATYNTEKRSHAYLHKTIRDNLLRASLMPPARLVAFFDGLLLEDMSRETHDFQANGGQQRVMHAFRETLLAALAEEDPADESRVLAAVVLGSFASGAAGPRSDFDVELVTADGSRRPVAGFTARLTAAWQARGYHGSNPVTVHDRAALPTRAYQDLVHSGDYYVVSADPFLEAALSRGPGDGPAFEMRQDGGLLPSLGLLAQKALIHATILREELKRARK